MTEDAKTSRPKDAVSLHAPDRPLVLIGMMGAGKSSLGGRLANALALPFFDADAEIEKAAGMPIADIFANHGEAAFRDGERRVIKRLVARGPQVLALGGLDFLVLLHGLNQRRHAKTIGCNIAHPNRQAGSRQHLAQSDTFRFGAMAARDGKIKRHDHAKRHSFAMQQPAAIAA